MTNQKKHQLIYERTGIEPKYVRHEDLVLEETKMVSDRFKGNPISLGIVEPYYPAEQLIEIIKRFNPGVSYGVICSVINNHMFKDSIDFHEACLDTLVSVIKVKGIKPH